MKLSVSFVAVGVALSVLVLSVGDCLAGRPGETRDRHFRKSERGPGIFTDRMAQRKAVRTEKREQVVAEARAQSESAAPTKAKSKKTVTSKAPAAGSSSRRRAEVRASPSDGKTKTVRVKKRSSGRGGKGSAPSVRRRVVLKPLFGN